MSQIELPKPIELTAEEQELLSGVSFDLDAAKINEDISQWCDRAHDLMVSLIARDAIPTARWEFFTNPDHNPGGVSRYDVFVRNGNQGHEVFRHVHFLMYHLRYMLFGPQLPAETIGGFCEIVNADRGTSGMVLKELCRFVRGQVRDHRLAKDDAGAFYLLALECGRGFNAGAIRSSALAAVKRR